nr:hypothetical protein [Tanacetum cinerariifolium]
MKEEEVNRCQIQEWYPRFKSSTIKTIIHELPESFIQYLLDDSGPIHNPLDEEDYTISEQQSDSESEPSSPQQPPPSFPELESQINESIETLVGISQREVTGFYPVLIEEKDKLETEIRKFYTDKVTLPLMFTWEELESEELMQDPEFRIVDSQLGLRPGLKTAVPYDYLDTSEGSGWDQFMRNADEELRKQTRSAGA